MNIKELKQQTEVDKEYTYTLSVKEVYRTPQGFYIITTTDGTDSIKLTTANHSLVQETNLGDVSLFKFKTKLFNEQVQGDLIDVSAADEKEASQLQELLNKEALTKYAPKDDSLLIETEHFSQLKASMLDVATKIRQAVIEQRPVHISHHNDCDGYTSGILLEKTIRSLIERYHPHEKFVQQYISRFPSRTPYYDIIDATRDAGFFLNSKKRFNVPTPLIIIIDNGSTEQDLLSIEKVKLYGADVVVIDHHDPGTLDEQGKSKICHAVIGHVNPHLQGIKEGLSASMLAYQVCQYINRHDKPDVYVAALGGVADRCQGKEIDMMVEQTQQSREQLWEVAMFVDYEIFMTKTNLSHGGLFTLLYGPDKDREKLISLYKPIKEAEEKQVKASLEKYATKEQWGNKQVVLVDGDKTALWSDYYSIGKLAGISFDMFNPTVCMVHTDSIIVFRAQKEQFDVNALLTQLKDSLVHARISGGGHAVAGSIKFLPAAKEEVMQFIKQYIQQ